MSRGHRQISATGFYVAIALIAYALIGAATNDLYLPGRHGRGVHLRYETIPPALLAITLYALTFPLSHFRESIWLARTTRALKVGAAASVLLCAYFIIAPTGKRLASVEECQATFLKLEKFTGEMTEDNGIRALLRERGSECTTTPILKAYYACVDRAELPADVNACHREAEALYERGNSSRRGR